MNLYSLLIFSAFAQESPDSNESTNEDVDSTIESKSDTETPEKNAEDPSESDPQKKVETPVKTDVIPENKSTTELENPEESTLIEEEYEQLIQEIFSEESLSDGLPENIEDYQEESEDKFNYRGNFYYSYQIHRWKSPTIHTLYSVGIAGDPQYWFSQGNWGPTLGMRFQLAAIENQQQVLNDYLIGITTGMQFGAFRINTAGSWMSERYFFQDEIDKDAENITYRYDELEQMSGVMWEQTLTFSPDDKDFGIQLAVGFPFQIKGEREMGEVFVDSWTATSTLNYNIVHLGYSLTKYPGHEIQTAEIGMGILF